MASRFIVLNLVTSFYGREDAALTGKLLEELPAILHWAMVGRDRLMKRGHFIQPESAKAAVCDMEDLASPISAFIRERCVLDPKYSIRCSELFDAWVSRCRDNGRDRPGTTQVFGRDLSAVLPGVHTKQERLGGDQRMRFYSSIALQ